MSLESFEEEEGSICPCCSSEDLTELGHYRAKGLRGEDVDITIYECKECHEQWGE